jgi:hypothetical protein
MREANPGSQPAASAGLCQVRNGCDLSGNGRQIDARENDPVMGSTSTRLFFPSFIAEAVKI